MKTRLCKTVRPVSQRRRFAFHPLSFAVCLAMSGPALALPGGGSVVAGTATISQPSTTSQLITQTTNKAIIDWKSFSIATGEQVRFSQPSSSSITLNRVTGYDPSSILGQLSSNGKIFLVNPYGVVFGANARVDVGGLVASSLSIANNDFLAGRYSLTSVDPGAPTQRGEVRNDGVISAPGGLVVLAGPTVSNSGTIAANGGRVGLAAANAVSVDVEGDGLVFFDAAAADAKNRLAQLGRIQADGGTVEMRAAARGAFADTVLNMTGVVQARSIGTRNGRIVIDGGSEGIVAVSGQIDATGSAAGQHGGDVTVFGQRVLLDNGTRIDASGDAGGGAIRVGGDFHGANPALHNAEAVAIESDVELHADALGSGNGGTVAVWADGSTKYLGNISARGGSGGGNGGYVEVSGKQSLDYEGNVDTRAPAGTIGTLLLDPTDITIDNAGANSGSLVNTAGHFTDPNTPSNIKPSTLVTQLKTTDVIVDTTSGAAGGGTITVKSPIDWSGNANVHSLTLEASSDITINAGAPITSNGGSLNLYSNGNVTLNSAVSLAGGSFKVAAMDGSSPAPSFASTASITTTGPDGVAANATAGGNVTILTTGDISVSTITARGGSALAANFAAAGGGVVTLTTTNGAISTGAVDTSGGAGSSDPAGAPGGQGGAVAITVGAAGSHLLTVGAIRTVGGTGSANTSVNGQGGSGGAGGAVSISNLSSGNTTTLGIDTHGGTGGGGGATDGKGGDGGAAGNIVVASNSGTVSVTNLTATGGTAGAGLGAGGPGNAGADHAISINFAQTAAGTLDLTNAVFATGSAATTATGGTGSAGIIVVAGTAEDLTLSDAARSSVAGNVALASVETASITAGTGTGTTNVSGGRAVERRPSS